MAIKEREIHGLLEANEKLLGEVEFVRKKHVEEVKGMRLDAEREHSKAVAEVIRLNNEIQKLTMDLSRLTGHDYESKDDSQGDTSTSLQDEVERLNAKVNSLLPL